MNHYTQQSALENQHELELEEKETVMGVFDKLQESVRDLERLVNEPTGVFGMMNLPTIRLPYVHEEMMDLDSHDCHAGPEDGCDCGERSGYIDDNTPLK